MSPSPIDRDSFYSDDNAAENSDAEWEDDGDEYELEPPDEEVIEGEKLRASQAVRDAADRARVDELFKGPEQLSHKELLEEMPKFEFKFSVKHMLIAMVVLAVGLTISFYLNSFAVIIVLSFILLSSAYGYMSYREHQHRQRWYDERTKLADRDRGERD